MPGRLGLSDMGSIVFEPMAWTVTRVVSVHSSMEICPKRLREWDFFWCWLYRSVPTKVQAATAVDISVELAMMLL